MSVLLLRLAGPLQSWGDSSRFVQRNTRQEPTKSGVLGLIAAAQGRHRVDPIEDLANLLYGVRTDQRGQLVRDFQTAQQWQTPKRDGSFTSMPLSYRYYLADAVFVAGIEADSVLLHGIHAAIMSPAFPLYLGRRSCPPTGIVSLGVREGGLRDVLRSEKWHASEAHQRTVAKPEVELDFVRDAIEPDELGETVRDVPLNFNPERREYGWRTLVREAQVVVKNPHQTSPGDSADSGREPDPDFLATVEES
ncbi:MAG TPA: type I-E CRISPR-associated protein Cas5/CasD [Terrimesophilobacter sp.]|nr:type I-E CRISPR-associated protein Cas5/CasD [Terrimesophilobacter sp.]HRP99722.1 type I-E CRISPR-associated protein Cas5/CasD [Terrimesophilobacter sp.]